FFVASAHCLFGGFYFFFHDVFSVFFWGFFLLGANPGVLPGFFLGQLFLLGVPGFTVLVFCVLLVGGGCSKM
ncbi:hypothetical protein ACQWHL_24525, partial [Salmonella enterica subsp. enterica serovar Infantis]